MTAPEILFLLFGLVTQTLFLSFFAARRWWPAAAVRFGWMVYAFVGLGLFLGAWLLFDGQSWRIYAGPFTMAAWALLGVVVDIWRPRQWRRPPISRSVFIPYLALYFFGQMFMWWPLWDIERAAWTAFLVLFVPSTVLNILGHFENESDKSKTRTPSSRR